MASRVLARRGLVALESHAARLHGYRLSFEEPGFRWVEPAFASVSEAADGIVHGVLHRVSDEDLAQLDRFEGPGYERVMAQVEARDIGMLEAFFYVPRRRVSGRRPSRRYVGLLLEGAREHELPAAWIARLEAEPTAHVSVLSGLSPIVLMGVEQLHEQRRRLGAWMRRVTDGGS